MMTSTPASNSSVNQADPPRSRPIATAGGPNAVAPLRTAVTVPLTCPRISTPK